jgi:hypothetical protein
MPLSPLAMPDRFRPRRHRFAALVLLFGMVECTHAADLATTRQSIAITTEPVDLVADAPDRRRIGDLTYRGGVALTTDHPAFGGMSGLWIAPDGQRFVTITDKGNWVDGTLTGTPGDPMEITDSEIGALGLPTGGTVADARGRDSEALARLSNGRMLVAFEGQHRILAYPAEGDPHVANTAERVGTPPPLADAPANKGPEALAALADGRLVMLTEGLTAGDSRIGFLRDGEGWHRLGYPRDPNYAPTDAAQLPGGDLLVLERRFDPLGGFQVRLRRIAGDTIAPGARLDGPVIAHFRPPYIVDNFEGLAVRTTRDGRTLVYLMSDDNFQPLQRTLLLVFALGGG